MTIRLRCPSCRTTLGVPDATAGKTARCSSCQTVFRVPARQTEPKPPSTASPAKPQGGGQAGQTVKCPGCKSSVRLPAGSQGKLLACPRCQKRFRVGGAPAKRPPTTPSPQASSFDSSFGSSSVGPLDNFGTSDFGSPSSFSPNPYQPSPSFATTPSFGTAPKSGRAEALYIVPGAIILGATILSVFYSIVRVFLDVPEMLSQNEDPAFKFGFLAGFGIVMLLVFIVQGIIIWGSINMIRRTGLTMARTAAILAAIPCCGGCVFPIGIWAVVMLFTGSVEKDFR